MKALFLIIAILSAGIQAEAARPDVRKMSCRDAAGLVESERAVVFTTGKYTYQRIVSSRMSCYSSRDIEVKTYAKTSDNDYCFIGYTCQNAESAGNGSSVIGASAPITCKDGVVRSESRRNEHSETVINRYKCRQGRWIALN